MISSTVVLLASLIAGADPGTFIKEALAASIIPPRQTLEEVQAHAEGLIRPLPKAESVEEWDRIAKEARKAVLDRVVFRGEAKSWREAPANVQTYESIPGPGYSVTKLRYEAVPGLFVPALLYVPEPMPESAPVVLNVNGHDSKGKAADYKQIRCINQAKRGMIALNLEWLGMGQLNGPGFNHACMNQLDLCGTSGESVFYLAMTRGLDILLDIKGADRSRVAVTGLSGGGWQTIFVSALDERVTLSVPVAGYSSFFTRARFLSDLGDSEQTPTDLAATADYATLTAMLAPRPAMLVFNAKDNCCFKADHALPPLKAAAEPAYALYGKPGNLRTHINEDPGDHNYGLDNRQAFYRMIGDHFFAGRGEEFAKEIPSDSEIRSSEELKVELPEDNAGFTAQALRIAKDLPRPIPAGRDARTLLREIVAVSEADFEGVEAKAVGDERSEGDIKARDWTLKVGPYTLPAVELTRGEPKESVLVIADGGRASAAVAVAERLRPDTRVLAVDPFYFGSAKVAERDYLYALLLASGGKRPLGIQAAEVAAVARWWGEGKGPVALEAIGPRTSTIALVAAALDRGAIDDVTLRDARKSLRDLIDPEITVLKEPEQFCFGLLEYFDLPQLEALAAPRAVTRR